MNIQREDRRRMDLRTPVVEEGGIKGIKGLEGNKYDRKAIMATLPRT